jgi:hypothetical protein
MIIILFTENCHQIRNGFKIFIGLKIERAIHSTAGIALVFWKLNLPIQPGDWDPPGRY